MADNDQNPSMKIGAPQAPTPLGQLMAFHAANGTLASFLVDIGWYYGKSAPGDPVTRKPAERER